MANINDTADTEDQWKPKLGSESLKGDVGRCTSQSICREEDAHGRIPILATQVHIVKGAEELDIAWRMADISQ